MPKRKNIINTTANNDSEIEYEVEKIKDKRIINGKIEYLIKWMNYTDEESTWEPIENMKNSKLLIEEYENQHLNEENESNQNNKLGKKKSLLFTINKIKIKDKKLKVELEFNKNQNIINNKLNDFFLKKKKKGNNIIRKNCLSFENSENISEKFDIYSPTKKNKNLNLNNNKFNNNNNLLTKRNIKYEISVENSFSYIQNKIENGKMNDFTKQYEIKEIISCCKYNNNIIICVSAKKKENLENKLLNLFSKDIAEIAPKLLIKYYESHIQFSLDK